MFSLQVFMISYGFLQDFLYSTFFMAFFLFSFKVSLWFIYAFAFDAAFFPYGLSYVFPGISPIAFTIILLHNSG